jgi:hypothetical protein
MTARVSWAPRRDKRRVCCNLPEALDLGRPARDVVERDDRTRQPGPCEAAEDRRGEAGKVDLDDLLRAEELVEAAAENGRAT